MVAYSFNKRFIQSIEHGLRVHLDEDAALRIPPKRQTIRAIGRRRHATPGAILQLYTGMRTKQCRKIGDARCTSVGKVQLRFTDFDFVILLDSKVLGPRKMQEFARADGFQDWQDMFSFWRREHGNIYIWDGIVIRWEPIVHG